MKSLDRSVIIQAVIGLVMVVAFSLNAQTVAAAYGMFIGLVNIALLSFTFNKANKRAAEDPKSGILILYMSAVIRFVLLAVLFILGPSLLFEREDTFAMVITFVVMLVGKIFDLKGKRRLTD